jgi:hypothetical protein
VPSLQPSAVTWLGQVRKTSKHILKKNKSFIFLKYTQWQLTLSFDNSTVMY